MADYRPVYQLFAWCDRHRIGGIAGIEPSHVAAYIENLQHAMSKPTAAPGGDPHAVRLAGHRPGCRSQSCAHTVRGPKHVVKGGKTTVLTAEQACERLDSIDITPLAAHTPAKQKVIINEMPLGVASDWDTFAQACNVTFMCSHANVSAERLRSHVRFFAAYLEDTKVAQCAVAFRDSARGNYAN